MGAVVPDSVSGLGCPGLREICLCQLDFTVAAACFIRVGKHNLANTGPEELQIRFLDPPCS